MNRMIYNPLNTTLNLPDNRNSIYNKVMNQLKLLKSKYRHTYYGKYNINEIVIDKSLDDYLVNYVSRKHAICVSIKNSIKN